MKELAFLVTSDADHKFDLALQLDDLDAALEIVRAVPDAEAETKWKAVGDRALTVWRFDLARECFEKAGDLNALMLLLLSTGDQAGLRQLATKAGKLTFPSSRRCLFSNVCDQSKGAKTTSLLQHCFRLGMLRHASTFSQRRNVYQKLHYLRERMLRGMSK